MNFPHFLRIERDERGRPRHYVVHTVDPKFALELTPDSAAPDRMGRGVIKRICVPNSWAGDYGAVREIARGRGAGFFCPVPCPAGAESGNASLPGLSAPARRLTRPRQGGAVAGDEFVERVGWPSWFLSNRP